MTIRAPRPTQTRRRGIRPARRR